MHSDLTKIGELLTSECHADINILDGGYDFRYEDTLLCLAVRLERRAMFTQLRDLDAGRNKSRPGQRRGPSLIEIAAQEGHADIPRDPCSLGPKLDIRPTNRGFDHRVQTVALPHSYNSAC